MFGADGLRHNDPMPSRTATTAATLAAAFALTACSVDTAPAPDSAAAASPATEQSATPAEPSAVSSPSDTPIPEPTESEEPESSPAAAPTYPPFDERTDRALQTIAAMEATLGAGAFKVEGDDDGTEWKLELARGDERLKVKAEADGTGLATTKTDRDDLDDDDRGALSSTQISLSEAIARVVEQTGGVLDGAELEEDDGVAFWEVVVLLGDDDEDYRVDLATGEVSHDD